MTSRLPETVPAALRSYFPACPVSWIEAAPRAVSRASAYREIFERAERTDCSVLLILDGEERGMQPGWMDGLLRPAIHSRYDLVTPVNAATAAERLLSANLVAPLIGALFGASPAQPMSRTFVLSRPLLERLLSRHDWESAAVESTPELWINMVAAGEGYRRAEARTGESRRALSREAFPVQGRVAAIAGSLFSLMAQYEPAWLRASGTGEIDCFGPSHAVPRPVETGTLARAFRARFRDAFPVLREPLGRITSPATLRAFESHFGEPDGARLPDPVWVRAVYEVAGAWKGHLLPRSQVASLLVPLYWARLAAWLEPRNEPPEDMRRSLGSYFVALRPVLDALWTGRRTGAEAA